MQADPTTQVGHVHDDFDLLIQRAGAVPAVERETLDAFVSSSRPLQRDDRRRGRRPLVVAGAVTGVLLLAAGASTTVLTLQRSPYQGLPDGVSRTSVAIPVDYVSASGAENHCQAYLELHHATPEVVREANTFAATHDWAGLGQRAYDAAAVAGGDDESISTAFGDEVGKELRAAALRGLPITSAPSAPADRRPTWNGFAMHCPGGQR